MSVGITNGAPVSTERRGLLVGPVSAACPFFLLSLFLSLSLSLFLPTFLSLIPPMTVSVRLDFEGGTDVEYRTPRPRIDPLHAIRRGCSRYVFYPFSPTKRHQHMKPGAPATPVYHS